MGGGAHYGAMYLGWKRQRDFVERYIRYARRSAWGDESGVRGIPGIDGNVLGSGSSESASFAQGNGAAVLNRRQKREQDKEAKRQSKKSRKVGSDNSGTSTPVEAEPTVSAAVTGPQGSRKKVTAENGKVLIVDSMGHVFLVEEDEDGEKGEYLLDPNEISKPSIRDTFMYRFPIWVYRKTRTRILGEQPKGQKLGVSPKHTDRTTATQEKSNGSATRKSIKRGQWLHA